MDFLLSNYADVFSNALLVGAIIGAFGGTVYLTAAPASDSIVRVFGGMLIGGLIMAAYQALNLGLLTGAGIAAMNPLSGAEPEAIGGDAFTAFLRIIQAALAGGLLAVSSVAPFQALKGAIGGVVIGSVAGALLWFVLDQLNTDIPLVLFGLLALGLVLWVFELLPAGNV